MAEQPKRPLLERLRRAAQPVAVYEPWPSMLREVADLERENAELRRERQDLLDTITAMLREAGVPMDDLDAAKRMMDAAGPKPSHTIAKLRARAEHAEQFADSARDALTAAGVPMTQTLEDGREVSMTGEERVGFLRRELEEARKDSERLEWWLASSGCSRSYIDAARAREAVATEGSPDDGSK